MKVRYDEGLAIRIGPKPCVDVRKDVDEASVGEGTGQPLSHEICNWGDTTQTVSGFQRKNRNCLTRSVQSYGMFKPPLRAPFPGMHEHCPLRLGLGPRYAR